MIASPRTFEDIRLSAHGAENIETTPPKIVETPEKYKPNLRPGVIYS